MNEELTLKEELEAAKQERESRTILLTSRSHSNIMNNIKKLKNDFSKKATVKNLETKKKELEEYKENVSLKQNDMEKIEKAIQGLNDVIDFLAEDDLINQDIRLKQVDAKPIKLVSKMFGPITTTFNYYYKKITNKFNKKEDKQQEQNDNVDKRENVEVQVVTDFERSKEKKEMAKEESKDYELPKNFDDFESRLTAAIEKAIKEDENKVIKSNVDNKNEELKDHFDKIADKFANLDIKTYDEIVNEANNSHNNHVVDENKREEKVAIPYDGDLGPYYTSDGSPVLDIDEIKQNYINVVNKVKEQNESLEKKEEEIRKAEEAQKQAEEAQKQVIDKLIQQTIAQQNILSERMERESELNRQLSLKEKTTARINLETEELLSMLESSSEKKETNEKAK